jgi:cytochrome b-561
MATSTETGQAPAAEHPRGVRAWLDDRLDLTAFQKKYGRKAFPVHSTFFLGEMALFAFIILVLTGIYLGIIYVPSNAEVTIDGETDPQAFSSVQLIESIPVANLFRRVHHWAAHLMIASIVLHTLRIYFTGTYRKPREINWFLGVVLLGLTLMAGFVGYALPYDSFAVTATGIGFSIARSIPWIGHVASELFFGGIFPTLGSLPRLYTIHVFIVPVAIALVLGLHLLIVLKQKHTQPGYARKLAEPGKVLGVPLLPYQALLAFQLLMLMFGVLFLLSALVPPHPLSEFGPPGPTTPEVKPDWYLLWIYGFLKIVPSQVEFDLFGAHIGADFIGGLLFPALVFGLLTLTPLIDRTNRMASRRFEYLEPPRQGPVRLAAGIAMLTFIGTLFLAAFYDEIGMSLREIWLVVIAVPVIVGIATYLFARARPPGEQIDPREELLAAGSVASVSAPAATTPAAPDGS